MSTSSRTLISLPTDILVEILSHLLLDTPRSPSRTSVLRTCSTLHALGLPLLHRVLDLRRHDTVSAFISSWSTLFGPKGTLHQNPALAASVHELRIGTPRRLTFVEEALTNAEPHFLPTLLPSCHHLLFSGLHFRSIFSLLLPPFLSLLPITHLVYTYTSDPSPPDLTDAFGPSFPGCEFRLPLQPEAWLGLEEVRFEGTLWYEDSGNDEGWMPEGEGEGKWVDRIAFSSWRVKRVVVVIPEQDEPVREDEEMPGEWDEGQILDDRFRGKLADRFVGLFLDPVEKRECEEWWGGLERVELHVPRWLEARMRARCEEEKRKRGGRGWARLQRRLLPLVVFVRGGEERALLEDALSS